MGVGIMDPLTQQAERVEIESLSSWACIPEHEEDLPEHESVDFEPLFPVRKDLNHKIYLWEGDIINLEVDAVVNSTNETLTDRSDLRGRIFRLGGAGLVTEVSALEGCRTGESKITKAHGLPCASHIIHTVGPRYNLKYKSAAENALHGCYRSTLQVLVENKLRTVAFCVINSEKRCYPKLDAAHVAFRTIRRCLEKKEWGEPIFSIVFAVDNLEDYQVYNTVMRLYFPRNNRDIIEAKDKYPEDTTNTNEFGAKIITERKIRIGAFPAGVEAAEERETKEETPSGASHRPIDKESGLKDFMTPTSRTPDERLRTERARKTPQQLEKEAILGTYDRLLQSAKKDDMSDFARRNCVYQSGVDALGRPIIVFVGARFPEKADKQNVQRLTRYILRIIDPIINVSDFVVIYFHAGVQQPQEPEFAWLKLMYRFCELKFLPRLRNFHIVHPSFWIKFTMKLLSPWMTPDFKNRIRYNKSLGDLFNVFDHNVLKIPDFVYQHDRKEHGSSYLADENPAN